MQEDDDFATPCPIFPSIRPTPKSKTSIIRKCKSSPPPKRSKSSQSRKENVPPLKCKGESSFCQPLDIPVDPNPCSIESQLYSLSTEQLVLRDEVAIQSHIPFSPPVNRFKPTEPSNETVSLSDFKNEAFLAFHRTFGAQPLDNSTDLKNHDSYSIESRLLSSSREHLVPRDEVTDEAEVDSESESRLDLLISLCSDANEDDIRICNLAGPVAVECPVCNLDISDLDEAARQFHTNACLDKCESPKISCLNDRSRTPQSLPENDSVSPQVVEWLRSLGLDKYEEAFTREEIDWDTLRWMTEEDLISIGVTALGPRKKIVQALTELRNEGAQPIATETELSNSKAGAQPISTETEMDNSTIGKTMKLASSRLITDYFARPPGVNKKKSTTPSGVAVVIGKDQSHSNQRQLVNKRPAISRKPRDTPIWCKIPGTPFRVDAFRYLRRDCTHWFLTHFHADHYQGLTRSFSYGKVYCSMITARLVHMKIGIPWDTIVVLPLNQRINIVGVHVTCFDANHCPGSVIILFEPPNGCSAYGRFPVL